MKHTLASLALCVTAGLQSSHAASLCGDCDLDRTVDVLDALFAAQHAVGVKEVEGCAVDLCNVDGMGAISILDALQIAQSAAGLPILLFCPPSGCATRRSPRLLGPTGSSCPTWPGGRQTDGLVNDTLRRRVLFFGGGSLSFAGGHGLADHWEWDGLCWTEILPRPGAAWPAGREQHRIVFDEARGVTMLFGGVDNSTPRCAINDTWTWDGIVWTLHSSPVSPEARGSFGLAYDPGDATRPAEVVLFGGATSSGSCQGCQHFGDTWVWDGSTWTEVTPPSMSPPTLHRVAMEYFPPMGQIILFGGDRSCFATTPTSETWAWDGATRTWAQVSSATVPPARADSTLTYDPCLDVLHLFGGEPPGGTGAGLADHWFFDGVDWCPFSPVTPIPPRRRHGATFDRTQNETLIQGGANEAVGPSTVFLDDLWAF